MLQICQLSKLRISSLFEKATRSNFIPMRSLISGNKMYNVCSFWFVCVRPEIGLVICRKPHHIERLCTGDEREHSHLTAIRDPSCFRFFFFFSFCNSFCNHEGVTSPSRLQGSSVVSPHSVIVPLSIFSFTSLKSRLCNAGVTQYEACSELQRLFREP